MIPYRKRVLRSILARRGRSSKIPQRIPLPPALQALELVAGGRALTVVRSALPSDYERGLMQGLDWGTTDVVWLLRHLLRRRGTLIDVGANIGMVTLPLALDGTDVIACEMLPGNCLKLHLACLLNRLLCVRVVQAAISSTDGMLAYGGSDAWGSVGTGAQQALALRLDTIIQLPGMTTSRRLVVKIDVEGHELEVLKGAAALIAARRPAILFESIEFADRAENAMSLQCKRLLETLGYRLLLQRGRRLLPRRAAELQEGVVADYLAVPCEAPHWLRGLQTGTLTPQERVNWIAEMAAQQDPGHRRHAVSAIVKLREEDVRYAGLTTALVAALLEDEDDGVRLRARTAFA